MMKLTRLLISLLAVLALTMGFAIAETTETAEDAVIAVVNGEELLQSEYAATETTYLSSFSSAGYNLEDEAVKAYVQDLALTAAIEYMLVEQDMQAQGCYDFGEETEAWLVEQGTAAYESALADVAEALRTELGLTEDDDTSVYALAYAEVLGVTAENYIDVYRTQYATVNYYQWLTQDNPVTDEDIQAAYEERVAESKALYENDVPAFETAMSAGAQLWYKPAGYRSILQILLPAEGEDDAAKLASVQETVDAVYARLEAGEAFETLIAEYGADSAFDDESFYTVGYQVHSESVIWEDAFVEAAYSEQMQQPGDWSQPFASDLGVHILYYLADSASGPVEMTADVSDLLAYSLYSERCQAHLTERVDELADSAEVVFPQ